MRNFYIVVEGKRTEQAVYPVWIRFLAPDLKQISSIANFKENNYLLFSGEGFPNYFNVIDNAIEDIKANPIIDYLIIGVDSEDDSFAEKKNEIENFVNKRLDEHKVRIIIQHFCIETWALGNRKIFKRNPQDTVLREYVDFFNVHDQDPELLPSYAKYSLNRAQLAEDYLKRILRENHPHLGYSKRNPKLLLNEKFYRRIEIRHKTTSHIQSFATFLDAFK